MFETEFKLSLTDITQILPCNNCVHNIYPLSGKPRRWDELKLLERDLKVQDRVYFQFEDNWYELVCLRGHSIW